MHVTTILCTTLVMAICSLISLCLASNHTSHESTWYDTFALVLLNEMPESFGILESEIRNVVVEEFSEGTSWTFTFHLIMQHLLYLYCSGERVGRV